MSEIAFCLAGLDVLVRSDRADERAGLPSTYGGVPAGARDRPGLIVEIEHVAALGDRPKRADHPAFGRRRDGDVLVVERGDAEGRIEVAATPVRAHFRVSDDPYALEACVRVALSVALPRHGALILHSSAVRWGGAAHVFSGVSGAGKSTIAALLARAYPACERLADELLLAVRADGRWTLEVPPFLGIAGLPIGATAPIASIDLLAQAPADRRTALPPAQALPELMRHVVVYAAEPITTEHVLGLVGQLVAEVPCFRLEFRNDPAVGQVLGIT